MARRAKPAGISAGAIEKGTMFGWWRVEDPTVIRKTTAEHDEGPAKARHAYVLCHCTACDVTTRPVRRAYLLNGRSTSCCRRGFAAKAAPDQPAKE